MLQQPWVHPSWRCKYKVELLSRVVPYLALSRPCNVVEIIRQDFFVNFETPLPLEFAFLESYHCQNETAMRCIRVKATSHSFVKSSNCPKQKLEKIDEITRRNYPGSNPGDFSSTHQKWKKNDNTPSATYTASSPKITPDRASPQKYEAKWFRV